MPDDLYIISDFHMGRGINPQTRRFFALENFFYDEDFESFCNFLCLEAATREKPFKLILNGDTFDLLRIDPLPTDGASGRERRFGPTHTPAQAARTVAQILAGHPGFLRGIAQVLNAGYPVIVIPGNHDIEVQWEPVQMEVRRALMDQVRQSYGETAEQKAAPLLQFAPWFYHEPQRIWIEHGCQYDPENSFRYLLRGTLAHMPDAIHEIEHDLPLGNFFQRYLYNFFGHITFIVPSTRANLRYVKWLLLHEPQLLLQVAISHGPFIFQVLRRLSRVTKTARQALQQAHDSTLASLAEESGLGLRLLAIDQLKEVRADAVQAVRSLGWQFAKLFGGTLLFALLTAGLWFLGFHSINQLRLGFGFKAMLFLFLDLVIAGATAGGILYATFGSPADVSPRPLRRAAQRIASILDVPIVSFGHSHDEELWRLERAQSAEAWYCNTGTWIAVFTHDVLMPRERVQYTFLRIRDDTSTLMHWSPGRRQAMPVILLDEKESIPETLLGTS